LDAETATLTPSQEGFLKKAIPSFNEASWAITAAGRAGSDRRFVRVKSRRANKSYVLIIWDNADHDWERFLSVQRDLSPVCTFLPGIFAADGSLGLILEEDLGALTLKKYCAGRAAASSIEEKYKSVLDALVQWQRIPFLSCATIAARDMDVEMFLWESDYFTTHCVREYFGLESLVTPAWEKERRRIAQEAAAFPRVCIHRDFQSENIMLKNGRVRFVDYQGARRGPAAYDLASLLYDPYVPRLTPALCNRLFEYYLSISPAGVTAYSFGICSLQRLMQALGAYANLSIHKGKEWYREYIPIALHRLHSVAKSHSAFPELQKMAGACLNACGKKRPV
jgi:aminoglycoside/choline kinase family phosphotransferase